MKINNKYYFRTNKVIETKNLNLIYQYIKDKKRISEENQDKLVDLAISSKDPVFIIKIARVLHDLEKSSYKISEYMEKLADAIIEINISDYIVDFCRFINKISDEKQDELVDAFIKSESIYYYIYNNNNNNVHLNNDVNKDFKSNQDLWCQMMSHPKSEYICDFVKRVRWLRNNHIEKLADAIISIKDIDYICKFLNYANISSKKMLELEKYILKNYKKDSLAKILKKLNNKELINMIYGSQSMLDNFLLDFKKYEKDNREFASYQTQDYLINLDGGYTGGVRSTSGFIPNQELRIMGHRQRTTEQLLEKYKFIDDNIKKVLNSSRYTEVIDNTDEKEKVPVLKRIKNIKR